MRASCLQNDDINDGVKHLEFYRDSCLIIAVKLPVGKFTKRITPDGGCGNQDQIP